MTNVTSIAAGGSFSLGITTSPFIRSAPGNIILIPGTDASFSVTVASAVPLTYQWTRRGTNVPGGTNPILVITNAQLSDADTYSVVVSNSYGAVSALGTLSTVPSLVTQPATQIGQVGQNAQFTVTAQSFAAPAYKWQFKGVDIAGATAAQYIRSNAQPANVGDYRVIAFNFAGSVASAPA